MAAPTLSATYLSTDWSATTTPKTLSVTTAVGDVLVLIASHSTPTTVINTPTGGTSLSWTLKQSFTAAGAPSIYAWTATATTAETFTCSVGRAATTAAWGWRMYRFSGSGGIGATVKTAAHTTGAPSQSITTTGASSAVITHVSDWNESAVTSRTWRTINSITPTAGNGLEKDAVLVSGSYSVLGAYWNDAGTAGAKTTGLTTQTGADYSMVSVEVLGSSGSNFSQTPSDSVTVTESSTRSVGLGKSDTATATEAAAKNVALAKSDSATASDSAVVHRGLIVNAADSVTVSESSARNVAKFLADSTTPTEAAVRNVSLGKSDTATATENFSRIVAFVRALSDSVTSSDTPIKNIGLAKSDSVTPSDSASASIIIQLVLSDSVTPTDSARRNVGKGLSDSATATDAIAKNFTRAAADSATLSESASHVAAYVRNFSDSTTPSEASYRSFVKAVSDIVAAGDVPTPGQILRINIDDEVFAQDVIGVILRVPQVVPGVPDGLTTIDNTVYLTTTDGPDALGANDINGILS